MSEEIDEDKFSILSALVDDIVPKMQEDMQEVVDQLEDKIGFLIDAECIEVEDPIAVMRSVLHVAIDKFMESIEEEIQNEEDEDEETERAY